MNNYPHIADQCKILASCLCLEYESNPFHSLKIVADLIAPQKMPNVYGWARISSKGDFELWDYEVGLLFISISVEQSGPDPYFCCRVHIGNIDDGEWQARSSLDNLPNAKRITDQVVRALFGEQMDGLRALPPSNQLNDLLHPFGMIGGFHNE